MADGRRTDDGLRAAAPGDVVGDEALFGAIYPGLRRFAGAVARRGDDPDDLVQDALVRVLAKGSLSRLDDPGRYLRVVVVRLASNARRRGARGDRALGRLEPPTPAAPADRDVGALERLDGLSPRDRGVLFLTVVEGWDHATAASMLGMRPGAVRMAKARALARLREGGEDR
jgi:RNA polymerase sigma-70 factor (ECF subfamily)